MNNIKQKKSWRKRCITALCILLVLFIGACVVAKIGYDMAFQRAGPGPGTPYSGSRLYDTIHLRYGDVNSEDYPRREVEFLSGTNWLRGHVYNGGSNKGLVVISHGLGAGGESYFAETLFFVQQGWCVFAYDNTGSYHSDGKSTKGISQSVLDLQAALAFVKEDASLNSLPIVLYGHSWGGYAVAAILNWHPEVKAVVSVAGFATPQKALYDFAQGKTGIFGVIGFPFFWGYHNLLFGENANISAIEGLNTSRVSALIIHGINDETLRYDVCGIIAHKEEITNPNVTYITRDAAGQDGHANLVFSLQALEYTRGLEAEWQQLEKQYNNNVPEEVQAEYSAKVDRSLASQLDKHLFAQINQHFEAAVAA